MTLGKKWPRESTRIIGSIPCNSLSRWRRLVWSVSSKSGTSRREPCSRGELRTRLLTPPCIAAYHSGQFASGLAGAASRARRGRLPPAGARSPGRSRSRTMSRPGVYASGEPCRDLLQQPDVAVRVAERRERPVAVAGPVPGCRRPPRSAGEARSKWYTSLTSMPPLARSSRATWMSETIRSAWVDPGAADGEVSCRSAPSTGSPEASPGPRARRPR